MKYKRGKSRSGQVWIETVIYTLIALSMIGLVLYYVKPKIEQLQDDALLKQSTEMLKQIDSTILTIGGTGNQRILGIGIKEGTLKIDGLSDKIIFEMESQSVYSEPGENVNDGNIVILTQKKTGYNLVTLTLDYSSSRDIKFEGKDILKTIGKSSTSYKLSISNDGTNAGGETILNMSLS